MLWARLGVHEPERIAEMDVEQVRGLRALTEE